MSTYKQTFAELDTAALMPFFVIGDPDYDTSLEVVKSAIDAGADILELGLAFSDPVADGPVIQNADIRAIKNGMTAAKAIDFVREITAYKSIPVGLLVYYNLVYQYGVEKFFADFKAAGGTSVLVADLTVDDADEVTVPAEAAGLETVFMVTPNTTDKRADEILSRTTGFVYTVSTYGVTGAREALSDMVRPLVKKLKNKTDLPICVGFGISSPAHAVQVAEAGADGVIIGSKIVGMIEKNLSDKEKMKTEISEFIRSVKGALNETSRK